MQISTNLFGLQMYIYKVPHTHYIPRFFVLFPCLRYAHLEVLIVVDACPLLKPNKEATPQTANKIFVLSDHIVNLVSWKMNASECFPFLTPKDFEWVLVNMK